LKKKRGAEGEAWGGGKKKRKIDSGLPKRTERDVRWGGGEKRIEDNLPSSGKSMRVGRGRVGTI